MSREQFIEKRFNRASEATISQAQEIISEYSAQGFTLTLRQLYYQFVARGIRENTERSYKSLGKLITDARMAGLISWNAIEDRGRDLNAWLINETERSVFAGIEMRFALDYWERQGVYVEVWVEKDALSSVIRKPCMRWNVPYMACKGYLSASEAYRAGKRFEEALEEDRRCVLIHLGDHDPSGIDMTRDNADRLELFANALDFDHGVTVKRIALNRDQVDRYNPPPNPAKITDSRAADYIRKHGKTSWELDALEPRVVYDLIEDEITQLIDMDVWGDTSREEDIRRDRLRAVHREWPRIAEFIEEIENES